MPRLVPTVGMTQELPDGKPGGKRDQKPVERHGNERPAQPAEIADPDRLEARHHAAAIAEQQHRKSDAGRKGAQEFRPRGREAAAADLGRKIGQEDGVKQGGGDDANGGCLESQEASRPEVAPKSQPASQMDQPGLEETLVHLFSKIRCRPEMSNLYKNINCLLYICIRRCTLIAENLVATALRSTGTKET